MKLCFAGSWIGWLVSPRKRQPSYILPQRIPNPIGSISWEIFLFFWIQSFFRLSCIQFESSTGRGFFFFFCFQAQMSPTQSCYSCSFAYSSTSISTSQINSLTVSFVASSPESGHRSKDRVLDRTVTLPGLQPERDNISLPSVVQTLPDEYPTLSNARMGRKTSGPYSAGPF